jgi:DNA-binding winged helix-turn-helix (wHTH) protein/cytochrome c-type biogenesis protein CcmH/NrfG
MPPTFAFGPFELDPIRRRLSVGGEPAAISDRHLDILIVLVQNAGRIVAKDDLVRAGWQDVAVSDNSLEQAISTLRRLLGERPEPTTYIDTVARRGYRFAAPVQRVATRESDDVLDALLAPHRAFVEGRAALESFDPAQVTHALDVFAEAVRTVPDHAVAHIGLATACVMRYEMTRADPEPDRASLARAERHAREACRLDPESAEAWATLGFALGQTADASRRVDALAALRRATTLESSNWRHHFRFATVSWGEERLRAAHRTLALLPGSPLAHWMAATVFVARQLPEEAVRELTSGIESQRSPAVADTRFGAIALHWLRGLIHLAGGDETGALDDFARELEASAAPHLYARECAANTWYAMGAVYRRQGRTADAEAAFGEALARIPAHPMARAALGLPARGEADGASVMEIVTVRAAQHVLAGESAEAGRLVDQALGFAPPGNAAWLLPLEPIFHVSNAPAHWAAALARLRTRAS